MLKRNKILKVSTRLMVIFCFINSLFGLVVYFMIHQLSTSFEISLEGEKSQVQSIVEASKSLLSSYYDSFKRGEITEQEAKKQTLLAIRQLRYENGNYVWINDLDGNMLMHPSKPELEGTSVLDFKDPNGKFIFQEFISIAKNQNEGFSEYLWPKPNATTPTHKVSFVSKFEPWNWIIGSGTYLDRYSQKKSEFFQLFLMLFVAFILYISAILYGYFGLIRHNLNLLSFLSRIANKENVKEIPCLDRKDEIGKAASAVYFLQQKVIEADRSAEERTKLIQSSEKERKASIQKIATSFEQRMMEIVSNLTGSSSTLTTTAEEMTSLTSQSSNSSKEAVLKVQETTAHINDISLAAKQLYEAVSEISLQVHKSNDIVRGSVEKVKVADQYADELRASSQNIREVLKIIADISQQINLLALNATIESARAGEAGKGFAVVANEVKNLATQTNSSIDQIQKVIDDMSKVSESISHALEEVKGSVDKISESSVSIASAVEEQTASTNGIAQSIEEASRSGQRVASELTTVTDSSLHVSQSSENVLFAARELSSQSEKLNSEVLDFIQELSEK